MSLHFPSPYHAKHVFIILSLFCCLNEQQQTTKQKTKHVDTDQLASQKASG